MKRIISVFLSAIILIFPLILASCQSEDIPIVDTEQTQNETEINEDIENFTFFLRWGTEGQSSYDSESGELIKTTFVCVSQHLVCDTCGIANSEDINTTICEFLRNPVDCHIALCAYQYLCFSMKRLVYGFYQCCGLSRSWRAMHDSNIVSPKDFVDSSLL